MDAFPVVLSALLIALVVGVFLAAFALWRYRRMPAPTTDYRAFFVMGNIMLLGSLVFLIAATWLDVSWAIGTPVFILAIVYTALGWSHRAEWGRR